MGKREAEMESQVVVFNLADEHYGVEIAAVDGIIKMQAITVVPRAPHFVEGVTNLRGEVLPVIDLRTRFGMAKVEAYTSDTRIVVVELSSQKVGMIVDAVTQVLRIQAESIEPPSPIVTTLDSAFIRGIAKVDERLVILLDLTRVLTIEETKDLQAVPALA
jgi:purine-binding chemotaxis protein CheW